MKIPAPKTSWKLRLQRMRWQIRKLDKKALTFLMRARAILSWTIIILLIATIVVWALFPDHSPLWTGFGKYDLSIPRAKTLWDWMELLIIPVVLAITAILFNKKLRDNDSIIAAERLREERLQAYFKGMSDLLLKHNLYKADKNDDVRFIARALTLNVMRQLDGNRKGIVLGFLHSTRLINCEINDEWEITKAPVIGLIGADLSQLSVATLGGNLSRAHLENLYLSDIDLSEANLYYANLSGSDLRSAWLIGANLESAQLGNSDLRLAFLTDANLKNVDFSAANLTNTIVTAEQLSQARSLTGCIMPNGKEFDPAVSFIEQCKLEMIRKQL